MCNTLRKVTFFLPHDGYMPDMSQEEKAELESLTHERDGYFHKWVEEVDSNGEIPCIKPMALVEDARDGKIYMIEYEKVTFTKNKP